MGKIILLMILSLSFVFSSCKSSASNKNTEKEDDCKCSYDTYQGDMKVTFLWNSNRYKEDKDKYKVYLKFIPKTPITNKDHFKYLMKPILFTLSSGEKPGSRFIRKYQFQEQTIYKNTRVGFLNNNAKACEKFIYDIEGVKRDDKVDSTTEKVIPVDLPNKETPKIDPKNINFRKPILYLYPLKDTRVTVKLDKFKDIAHSYPKYPENGWTVDVKTDGTIKYKNKKYYSLYWEMNNYKNYKFDEGFLVSKKEVIPFLEKSLKTLGFNYKESQEFIIYWLPKLESNDLNLIKFETIEYNKDQPIKITPKPDTLIRVMMVFKKVTDKNIKIKKQVLKSTKREGFVALEWGGIEL